MAIDKYVYVAVMETVHDHVKASYSRQETVEKTCDLENELIRETLGWFGIESNVEVTTFADLPTGGSGLGGSSAFTCALIRSLSELTGRVMTKHDVASLACQIEIEKCARDIGKQDQYASAFGGLNYCRYTDAGVEVRSINGPELGRFCVLVSTVERGKAAHEVISTIDFEAKAQAIRGLSAVADRFSEIDHSIAAYGRALKECWELKRSTSREISNPDVDDVYSACLEAGAYGGKLLGAGGGGYVLAVAPNVDSIVKRFPNRKCLTFNLDEEGARVVYK